MSEPEEVAVEIIPINDDYPDRDPKVIQGYAQGWKERGLQLAEQQADRSAPLWEIGALDDAEYEQRKRMLVAGQERIADLQRSLLSDGTDYGSIPGTGTRKVLLKPGAEKLAAFWRLVPTFTVRKTVTRAQPWGDPLTQSSGPDRIDYEVRCQLHHGSQDGPVVGEGVGEASSYERRYRYRNAGLVCPKCGQETVLVSRNDPGWFCWTKRGGCGANFGPDDASIKDQKPGQVENDDPHDLGNTLAKMGAKRAFVDAVIRTLGASALFTQDEDSPGMAATPPETGGDARSAASRTTTTPKAQRGSSSEVKDGEVGTFEGEVVEVPDGTRMTPSGRLLRVKIKVGNRNHQVELWDGLADEILTLIGKGSAMAVRGKLQLEAWQKDGKDMPPVRKIVDVAHVALRDEQGQWQGVEVSKAGPAQMPLADPPNRQPAHEGPALFDDDDPEVWGDATLAAKPPATLPTHYPLEHGEDGQTFDREVVILSVEPVTGAASPYVRLMVADGERQVRHDVVMEQAEATAQGVDRLGPGSIVRVVGTWWKSPSRGSYALMATAIA